MKDNATENDVPDIPEIKDALLSSLASGRSRSFDGIGAAVSKALGLTREQRAYRIRSSANTLFENRLVQARRELVKEGLITYRAGKVKIAAQPDTAGMKAEATTAEESTPGPSRAKPDMAAPTKSPKAPEGRPTKCLSFQEPWASYIVTGVKDAEFRSKKVNVPIRDLVVCASKTPKTIPYNVPGLAYGLAIGMVDVVDCVGIKGDHVWKLENPRMIKPFPVSATAGFFYVADIPEVIPTSEESYREHVLPHCFRGEATDEDLFISSLFAKKPDALQRKLQVDVDRFDVVRKRYPYSRRD